MATKNPKISAYVPQEVFDHFQEFQVEHGFSMSKAVIAILCDYFGIKKTTSGLPSGITVAEFQSLKERLTELEQKVENQLISQDAEGNDEVLQISAQLEKKKSYDETPSLPLAYPNSEPEQTTSKPLPKPVVLTAEELAERFGFKNPKSLNNRKAKLKTTEKFTEWSTEKDPEGIAWTYGKTANGRGIEYFPVQ